MGCLLNTQPHRLTHVQPAYGTLRLLVAVKAARERPLTRIRLIHAGCRGLRIGFFKKLKLRTETFRATKKD